MDRQIATNVAITHDHLTVRVTLKSPNIATRDVHDTGVRSMNSPNMATRDVHDTGVRSMNIACGPARHNVNNRRRIQAVNDLQIIVWIRIPGIDRLVLRDGDHVGCDWCQTAQHHHCCQPSNPDYLHRTSLSQDEHVDTIPRKLGPWPQAEVIER